MSNHRTHLQRAAKAAYKYAVEMLENGDIPTFLGQDAQLALMFESIKRYSRTHDRTEILNLAGHTLHALLHVAREVLTAENIKPPEPPEEEQEEEVEPVQDDDEDDSGRWTAVEAKRE